MNTSLKWFLVGVAAILTLALITDPISAEERKCVPITASAAMIEIGKPFINVAIGAAGLTAQIMGANIERAGVAFQDNLTKADIPRPDFDQLILIDWVDESFTIYFYKNGCMQGRTAMNIPDTLLPKVFEGVEGSDT